MKLRRVLTSLAVLLLATAVTSTQAHERNSHHRSAPGYGKHGVRHHPPRPVPVYRYGSRVTHGRLVVSPIVITLPSPRPAGVILSRPAYYAGNVYGVQRNRWYQTDVNGDCFEVALLQTGEQVWTQVAYGLCR